MSWLGLLALVLSLGAAWRLGTELAARALAAPSRLARASLGSGVGIVALGLPLLWLPRVVPVGGALALSGALCALGVVWLRRRPAPAARPDHPRLLVAALALIVLVYLAALAFWLEGTARGDIATLYLHSGLASSIARGDFPVVNPFEPDFPLQYRVTLHTLAAGAIALLEAPTSEVMPHVLALTAVVAVASVYGVLATVVSAPWALGGAVLSYAWGPLYWPAALFAVRERGLGDVLGAVVAAPETVAWSGVILGGPFTMPTHNPTVLHGVIPAVVALAAFDAAAVRRRGGKSAWVLLAAALIYLGASNEFLVFTVPVGLAAGYLLTRRFRLREASAATAALAAAGLLALLLSQTTSGVLAGAFTGDPDLGRLRPQLNTEHFGQVASWGYNSGGPWLFWPLRGFHDASIFSLEFLVDGGMLFWVLGLTLLWVVTRRGASRATLWALAAAANVGVVLVLRLEQSPADLYRVLHAGFTLAVPAAVIAAAEVAQRWPRHRVLWSGAAIAAGLVLSGAFLLTSLAWPRMVAQAQPAAQSVPVGALEFLRGTVVSDRLLVLNGARTAYSLYDGRSPRVTALISAATGQFIPYGYHHLSQAERYAGRYGWAQRWLRDADLNALGIRYVYVDPTELDATQAAAIAAKLADGRFHEAYRDPAGAVVIYAFTATAAPD